ncbi:MAG TPA: DUF3106 domain-containing protein [Bryobacteraceae bacterium]|nr:DUF3106 domain-containing protein [Bryobacteraceae bacterium]
MHKRLLMAAIVLEVCLLTPLRAQGRHGGAGGGAHPQQQRAPKAEKPGKAAGRSPIQEFEGMSPEERQRALDRLPPGQRERVQQRLRQFDQLPPEQKRQVQNQLERLRQLPPKKQEQVREAMRKFGDQPPDRKKAMRQELRGMESLSPSERQARLNSPDFKSKFNKDEQDMVKHMSEILPGQEK